MAQVIISEESLSSEFGHDQSPSEPNACHTDSTDVVFDALRPHQMNAGMAQFRRIPVPNNRLTALRNHWAEIYTPIVDNLKLQIRMNTKTKHVELRTSPETEDIGVLDRAVEFIRAYLIGFEISDAKALLRIEDLYLQSFNVDDVKHLTGDHLSRAIGRIAGKDGKTKFTIENATRTRIVLADKRISLLGSYQNIKLARDAVCDLILGAPPSKVYYKLQNISARLKERF
ncbi:RNA-binding protein PNO1-like [Schistocerca gregaria]|uniref:RNA-binding protein PNO1-like n=1 Tax=Schistocerca gregaria TaxID=7010 RepID=UPI00211E5CBB|nr:RNA-binding protein PNO1-like [Schistocerca gregaria]